MPGHPESTSRQNTFQPPVEFSPKTRSEYLQGKTELSDVDIINILDLPVEKRSINNEIYTDKSYKELKNNPADLSSLTENLKTNPEYLKYHSSYIAKSKLLYQESDVLCNEIPCLIVLDQLKKTSYLLPYEYAANKYGAAITSADALKSNTFTDFKRVFNSRLKKLIEKGIEQGKDIFFLINNKKLSHDEIKNQLIRFLNNRTSENKEGTYLFFSEKDFVCYSFESDKNGFITELPEYDLKEIRAAISSKPLTPSRESEKTSDSLASNLNITQEKSDVNELFSSLLLRGEITLLERKKDIENRQQRYFNALNSLEKLNYLISSDAIKESNKIFIQAQKETKFYQALLAEQTENKPALKEKNTMNENSGLDINTYRFQSNEKISDWDEDQIKNYIKNSSTSDLFAEKFYATEKEYDELCRRQKVLEDAYRENADQNIIRERIMQFDSYSRFIAGNHLKPNSTEIIKSKSQEDVFSREVENYSQGYEQYVREVLIPEFAKEEAQERYFTFDEKDSRKFVEHINEWRNDNTNPSKLIVIGKIPPVMKILGISEKPIEVEQSTLDKMIRAEPTYPNDKQGHRLSIDDIYAIPSLLADPVMIFKSKTRSDSFVFFAERKDFKNRSILIPLAVDKKRGRIVIHEITSMYGRNNEIDFVKSNIDENNLIYEDSHRSFLWAKEKIKELNNMDIKRKSSNGERFTQIQFLGQRFTDNGTYNQNILTKDEFVNSFSSDSRETYLEMKNGKWQPKEEAVQAVKEGKLFIEKDGQNYTMHNESAASFEISALDENGNTRYQTDEELLKQYKQKYPESSLSISEDTRNELKNVFSQIDDYLEKGTVPEEGRFTLPKVPAYLKELGSDETAISLPVSVIKKARETHGLSNKEIKNSLTRLYDPVAVFDTDKTKSENKLDSKLILTDEFSESKPIALALNTNTQIQIEGDGHRKSVEVQDIRSIHDRTLTAKNGTDLVKHWTEKGLCRYVDDKKISDWSTVARVYFPIEALQSDKNNILTKERIVNLKYEEYLQTIENQERYFTFDKKESRHFIEQVDEWISDKSNTRKLVIVGKNPPLFQSLGIADNMIEIEHSILNKIVRDEPVYPNEAQGHALSVDDIRSIPNQLADPIMVFKSRTRNDSYVFFTERKDSQNRSILIPLAVNKRKGRIVINEITSMYGRNNETDFVKTNIDEGNLKYMDKKRSIEWVEKNKSLDGELESKVQFLGQRITDIETYNQNILTKERIVNSFSSDSRENNIQQKTEPAKQEEDFEKYLRESEISQKQEFSLFDKELYLFNNGQLEENHVFNLGKPGEILKNCGFPENDRIELVASRLKIKARQGNHPFEIMDILGLDKALQNPIAVFEYGEKEKAQNVIVNLEKDGKNFLVGVFFNQKKDGFEVSSIRGLFNRDNLDWMRWIQQGKLIYGDKERIQVLANQQRTNLADVNSKEARTLSDLYYLDSLDNILQNFGDVKNIYARDFPRYTEQKEKFEIFKQFRSAYQEKDSINIYDAVKDADEFYKAIKNNDKSIIEKFTNGIEKAELARAASLILEKGINTQALKQHASMHGKDNEPKYTKVLAGVEPTILMEQKTPSIATMLRASTTLATGNVQQNTDSVKQENLNQSTKKTQGDSMDKSGKKSFNDTPVFRNASLFLEENKKGELPFFAGKEKLKDGKEVIEIKPHPVVDAITGRLVLGTNQVLAQDVFRKTGEYPANINIITWAEAKANGIQLKKGTPGYTISTKGKDNSYNIYKLFSENAVTENSIGNLNRAKYSAAVKTKIAVLNRQLEQEENIQNKSIILANLAYAHLDNIQGNILRPKEIQLGLENFRQGSELEKRTKEVSEYIENLPKDVKEMFKEKIMTVNGKFDNTTPEGLVKNYNPLQFEKRAAEKLEKAAELQKNRPEQIIDARNCTSATTFIAKYAAATSLAKANQNVKFITDKSTNEKIQKDLSATLEKSFSEYNHSKVFSIGEEANEQCRTELKNFRTQQLAIKSQENEIERKKDLNPSIDLSLS